MALGRQGIHTTLDDLTRVAKKWTDPSGFTLETMETREGGVIRASGGHTSPGFKVGVTLADEAAVPTRVFLCLAEDMSSKEYAMRVKKRGAFLEEQLSDERNLFHLRLQPVGYPKPLMACGVLHACVSTAKLRAAKCLILADQGGTLFSPGTGGSIPPECIEEITRA